MFFSERGKEGSADRVGKGAPVGNGCVDDQSGTWLVLAMKARKGHDKPESLCLHGDVRLDRTTSRDQSCFANCAPNPKTSSWRAKHRLHRTRLSGI